METISGQRMEWIRLKKASGNSWHWGWQEKQATVLYKLFYWGRLAKLTCTG